MQITRRKTKPIKIGNVCIGGTNPIAIQSMAKTETADIQKTAKQIKELQGLGCEIVRLAVAAIDNGADKIRLNPGNIYKKEEIREIVRAAKSHHIPIRVGVNSGSIPKVKDKDKVKTMVKTTLDYIRILERLGFYDIVVSLKSSSIFDTIEACRKISKLCSYPLHLGVTATGSPYSGAIKSGIALSALLLEGIGDTIRISLTAEPPDEVRAAKIILESLGLRYFGPQIISCPTCGRCEVDLVKIVTELENKLSTSKFQVSRRPIKLAVMGCVVNGPGEAKEADIGVAFGRREGLLFRNGKPIRKISPAGCVDVLLDTICKLKHN
ncbi:MAG: flavodoxin-dependent (E)-4-hydroxy-3-methylbut-2-enyl-diphosphate synthase [Candidatus Omnitrophica bacterium]|nr:flavodoxin-dependent (E)-4-hydroxy-3-methylbut-2-enyl-diphosphate synthase [Candidatus Omnitrophota bacterium]